ncbi:MAG TPA: transposase [Candidatus Binatia bacterium]|nr:transposase [Candidatus Binatia bacterium]
MVHTIHQVYQKSRAGLLANWQKRRSRALSPELLDAALMLLNINLDPLTQLLDSLYSNNPRGRTPYDPILMLRGLLMMTILHQTRIDLFVKDLRSKPRLALIAGFEPGKTPSVGAFYLFIDRLENGPFQPDCPHRLLPADSRHGKHLRNLKQEKAEKEAERERILANCDSITAQLKDDLLAKRSLDRPHDFQQRLEDILFQTAVIPSAHRGLLGDLNHMTACGDGSALVTGASPYGTPSCECRKNGIFKCDHDRFYSDRDANWGYDSYRDCYYFGHTYYQHIVSGSGHDLPLHITIGQASESDFTLSLKSADRLIKTARENKLDIRIEALGYDAGHDARGIYDYLLANKISPVIVLNHRQGQHPNPTGTADKLNDNGIPICPAGLEMRRHGQSPNHRIYFNCPVKRPTHENGKTIWKSYVEECPHKVLCHPDTKMSPIVYVRSDQDPRYYPPIPRDSARFKEIMNLRSGCERSNAMKKTVHHLGDRPCRSATHFLFRLYLVSIVEHTKAWLAEDRKLVGDDWSKLCKHAMKPSKKV